MTLYETFAKAYTVRAQRPERTRRATPRLQSLVAVLGTLLAAIVVGASRLRREALTLTGLGFLVAGAWTRGLTWGLVASGVGLLVLEWLTSTTSGADAGA